LTNEFLEREFWRERDAGFRNFCGDAASEGLGYGFQLDVKMVGLEQPVFAAAAAIQGNPVHGTLGEGELFRGVAREADAGDHGMLEARAHGGSRFMEIAARKIFF
jgi:hypothetical protein